MPKINQEEYEVLKKLDDRWKWIARNYNGALITYTDKPMKNPNLYWDSFGERMEDRLFQFIQWEDESPYNIAELIEEYEKDYKGSWEHAIEFSGEVFGESEETEVKKDKEWAIKEAKETINGFFDRSSRGVAQHYEDELIASIADIINQLDEPEVLSQKWIDDNKKDSGVHYIGYYVPIGRLHDLLVPKQELPVIPKFVAYVIEAYKSNSRLTNLLADLAFHGELAEFVEHEDEDEVFEWARSNRKATDEILARAWLDGFTVEEQKYYVRLGEKMYFAGWYETDATFVFDDSPYSLERAKTYNLKDGKEKVKELGAGELVKVEELEE